MKENDGPRWEKLQFPLCVIFQLNSAKAEKWSNNFQIKWTHRNNWNFLCLITLDLLSKQRTVGTPKSFLLNQVNKKGQQPLPCETTTHYFHWKKFTYFLCDFFTFWVYIKCTVNSDKWSSVALGQQLWYRFLEELFIFSSFLSQSLLDY